MLMDYKIFTSNLMNLKRMKGEHKRLSLRLDDLIYLETGVKGVSYGQVMVSHNPSLTALKRLDMVDKVDDLCRELNYLTMAIDETEKALNKMPKELKGMLTDKFIKGWTYDRVGEKYGFSHSGIQYRMEKETERYL